jgi:protein-S-isoprenylcysteine O-methyltransferase Ste14
VMATGGPYHYIRHPMYVAKVIQSVCIFFMTGLWPVLLGAPFWIALPKQAAGEEAAMRAKFGIQYEEYLLRTGRFFPKVLRSRE